ncbi:MAG: SEC-C metal-binding domain-containing protein [Parvibaculum sp.]|nr:SEC-C metal-binding domain-containing protein [Parvibaculum sp.]
MIGVIKKSSGLTPSERLLADLCENTFLSLWSYPNLFRDQGRKGGKGDGKELCDLVVVFGNDVVLFSDKSCQYPDSSDKSVNWSRWYKRAIQKSADQIYGAERFIKTSPEKIYLDSLCQKLFPFKFPSPEEIRFHRVVVALNASQPCKSHFGGKASGSLLVRSDVVGEQHFLIPFTIGNVDPDRGYIHVFDEFTLPLVLKELDTIRDFTSYLQAKEHLIKSRKLVSAAGEEELVAHYITKMNDITGEHDFIFPETTTEVHFEEEAWSSVTRNPQYVHKKQADRISKLWDSLIESFAKNLAGGTLEPGSDAEVSDVERGLRILAAEGRIERRALSKAFGDVLERADRDGRAARFVVSKQREDVAYAFVSLQKPIDRAYKEYRDFRIQLINAYCHVAKLKLPEAKYIVGIATESLMSDGRSEDLAYLDVSNWTSDHQEYAEKLVHDFGFMQTPRMTDFHEDEYPETIEIQFAQASSETKPKNAKVGRNKPCPCGSGLKFKKCHGK